MIETNQPDKFLADDDLTGRKQLLIARNVRGFRSLSVGDFYFICIYTFKQSYKALNNNESNKYEKLQMNILDIKEDKRISSHGKPQDIIMFLKRFKSSKSCKHSIAFSD